MLIFRRDVGGICWKDFLNSCKMHGDLVYESIVECISPGDRGLTHSCPPHNLCLFPYPTLKGFVGLSTTGWLIIAKGPYDQDELLALGLLVV